MGERGEKRKEEAREGRGNRQNKKEGGRGEERELALWEALRCHAPLSWPWVVWAGSSGSAQGLYGHSWVLRQPASWALPPLLPAQLATWVSASFCWPGEDLYRIQPEIRGHSG